MTLEEVLQQIKPASEGGAALHPPALVDWLMFYAAKAQAAKDNLRNVGDYEVAWDNWLQNRNQRSALGLAPEPEPQPAPLIKIVLHKPDSPSFYETQRGPEPCTKPNVAPPIPTAPDPNVLVVRVGNRASSDTWLMLAGDTAPEGYEVVHDGFRLRKKMSFAPPLGVYRLVV